MFYWAQTHCSKGLLHLSIPKAKYFFLCPTPKSASPKKGMHRQLNVVGRLWIMLVVFVICLVFLTENNGKALISIDRERYMMELGVCAFYCKFEDCNDCHQAEVWVQELLNALKYMVRLAASLYKELKAEGKTVCKSSRTCGWLNTERWRLYQMSLI